MVKAKKKKIDLVSCDYQIEVIIDKLKMNKSLYERILKTLLLLGNFDRNINCQLYETHDEDNCNYIKLWCEDIEGNIFVFCPISSIKHSLYFIDKYENKDEKHYDISLLKKFDITEQNIKMARTEQTYNFKFGRLITDATTFYNLFLSDNICHKLQLNGNEIPIDIKILLSCLNKLESIPTLKEYIEIFDYILLTNNIQYESISMASYKDFKNLGSLTIINEESQHKKLIKNKEI